MTPQEDLRSETNNGTFHRIAGVVVTAIALVVLAGWLLEVKWLTGLLPGWAALNFNTALCLLFYGGALAMLPAREEMEMPGWSRGAVAGLVCAAELLVVVTLLQFAVGDEWGVDNWIFRAGGAEEVAGGAARMSLMLALHLFAIGVGLLFLLSRHRRAVQFARAVSYLAGVIPLLAALAAWIALFSTDASRTGRASLGGSAGLLLLCAGMIATRKRPVELKRSRLVRKLALGFGLAALVILLVSVAALQSIREYQDAAKRVEHTLQVLRTLEALEAEIGNAEANRRGYALTNRAEFLDGCRKAMAAAEQDLEALRGLIADNPAQQERVAAIAPLVAQRLASLRSALEEQQSGSVPVQKQAAVINESLQVTPQIRAKLEEMRATEMELLQQRNAQANASAQRTTLMIVLTAVLAVVFFVPAGWSIRNEFLARQRAEEKLEAANRELAAANEAVTRELQKSQQLSAEVQQQSAMLSLVLDNMAEGLVMADPSGHFLVYNQAAERILGVPGKDLPPSEWPKYYSAYLPDGSAPFPAEQIPLARAIRGEACDGVEMQIRRPGEESPIWILINGRPVLDAGGKHIGGVVVFRDITAQRQAEQQIRALNQQLGRRAEELEQAVKELEAFSYSVSHDLRAPLRHMAGFTRILLEDYGEKMDAEQRRLFDRVAEGARQMGQLIDDLLDFSRISRRPLNVQWTGLSSLLEDARKTLEPELEGRNIEWRIGELPFVECDPALLRQVFQNLLANAVKFTRPRDPGVIEVGVEPSNGRPAVYVRDNGVGFSMKYAEKLFGVFQRLHRQEDFEGTGVGLATVQRIVRRHGGDVWAASEPNRGATFYFTLPALQPEAVAPEPREEKFST